MTILLNKIHCGDNLEFMRSLEEGKIDLIYIDPPFFTQTTQKSESSGKKIYYHDSWKSTNSYLHFLVTRVRRCHRLLKDTGVLCVHLDWRSSHIMKLWCDKIFGGDNFINEIVWAYNGGGYSKRAYPRKHDNILIFSKSDKYSFSIEYKSYSKNVQAINRGNFGGPFRAVNLERGTPVTDVWSDIGTIIGWSPENVGYPTQKPLNLVGRLIKAFTNKEDIVADFFCGSGTTLVAAAQLGRNFIGCDISKDAINISNKRLSKKLFFNKESNNAIA